MPDHVTAGELRDRLSLIENMIAEGRRSSESWGWMFVLWGATYLIAIAWAAWDHSVLPWPVIIGAALILTFVLGSKKSGKQPVTTLGRAVISIWIALAITMFLLFFALGISGRLTDPHLFISVVSAILGMANGAAGLIVRWKAQFACALVWWAAAGASCFGSVKQSIIVFVVAIFLCQIAFGVYGMIADAHERRRRGAANA